MGAVLAFAPCLVRIVGGWLGVPFSVESIQLFVLGVAGYGALWLGMRDSAPRLSSVAFPFLFLFSYTVRAITLDVDSQMQAVGETSLSFGRFSFTPSAYWDFTIIAVVGLSGLTAGQLVVRQWLRRRPADQAHRLHVSSGDLPVIVWLWFGLSVMVLVLSGVLGVGSSGLVHAELPFKITGLLHFSRTLILPLMGMYLFGAAVEAGRHRQAYLLLFLALLIGIASFPISLSKASVLYAVLPYIAYLSIASYHYRFSRKLFRLGVVALVLTVPVTVITVQAVRDLAYSSGHLPKPSEVIEEVKATVSLEAIGKLVVQLRYLVIDRIIGGGELMGVMAGSPYSSSLVAQIVLGQGTDPALGVGDIYYDLYGLSPSTVEGVYNGKAFGLFGLLYLTHKLYIVFVLTLVLGGLTLWIEHVFLLNMNAAVAVFVGFMLSIAIWEGGFDTLKFYPVLLGGTLVASKILPGKTRKTAHGS